jgi:hypothetical protein
LQKRNKKEKLTKIPNLIFASCYVEPAVPGESSLRALLCEHAEVQALPFEWPAQAKMRSNRLADHKLVCGGHQRSLAGCIQPFQSKGVVTLQACTNCISEMLSRPPSFQYHPATDLLLLIY